MPAPRMGVRGAGRRNRGRHSVNSVSVGRRDDGTVCGRVLGIREVDRPERLAVQREEGHPGAHVHGRRRVLSRESVRALGLPIQERRGARAHFGPLHRSHIWMASRAPVDYRRKLLHRVASGLRFDDAVGPQGGPLVRANHV